MFAYNGIINPEIFKKKSLHSTGRMPDLNIFSHKNVLCYSFIFIKPWTHFIPPPPQKKEDIMLINATLGVYMSIFSSILQHSHDHTGTSTLLGQVPVSDRSTVKSWVEKLQEKTKVLRRDLVEVNNNQEDMLRELTKIKVDDPIDQRRALAEFQTVYRAASLLGSSHPR
uniref:Uncharacterized protein n=1 Tax=Seriola lalandi dorsalis TaxID=1841481 RepID=A0A3B4XY70_SERLL